MLGGNLYSVSGEALEQVAQKLWTSPPLLIFVHFGLDLKSGEIDGSLSLPLTGY